MDSQVRRLTTFSSSSRGTAIATSRRHRVEGWRFLLGGGRFTLLEPWCAFVPRREGPKGVSEDTWCQVLDSRTLSTRGRPISTRTTRRRVAGPGGRVRGPRAAGGKVYHPCRGSDDGAGGAERRRREGRGRTPWSSRVLVVTVYNGGTAGAAGGVRRRGIDGLPRRRRRRVRRGSSAATGGARGGVKAAQRRAGAGRAGGPAGAQARCSDASGARGWSSEGALGRDPKPHRIAPRKFFRWRTPRGGRERDPFAAPVGREKSTITTSSLARAHSLDAGVSRRPSPPP